MEYHFDTFPKPPVAYTPVTSPHANNADSLRFGSGVELANGKVLHVWCEWKDNSGTDQENWIQVGYADSVLDYLTGNGSVTWDHTFRHTSCSSSVDGVSPDISGYEMGVGVAGVCRGPDGNLWLQYYMGGLFANATFDARVDTTGLPASAAANCAVFKSTDDGANWTFVATLPSASTQRQRLDGAGNWPAPFYIEEIPVGFTNAGRWIMVAASHGEYTGASVNGNAVQASIFTSDDDGASWTQRYQDNTGPYKEQIGPGIAFGADGYMYTKQSTDNVTGQTTYWLRSSDGATWSQYQSYVYPGSPDYSYVRAGPWFTFTDTPQRIYTLQPMANDSATSDDPDLLSANVAETSPPTFDTDYATDWSPTISNFTPQNDELLLTRLNANWAGLWAGTQVIGLPLAPCPTTTLLHIPNKAWWEEDDAETRGRMVRSNLNKIRSWADLVTREGATNDLLLFDQAWPAELVGGNRAVFEHMWLSIERWSRSVCWDDGVHVPYKRDPSMDYWNLLAFERWANRYS